MQRSEARCPRRLTLLVVLLVARTALSQPPRPPAPVVIAKAVQQTVAAGNTFVATVLPRKRAVLGSAVDGRVVELAAEQGQRVKKNQPLVRLLTATIELELAAVEAELDLRTEELAELENGARPNEIEQARAKMLSARARQQFAVARRVRLGQLVASQAVSQEEFDEAEAAATQAEQSFYDLKAAYELTVEGPRPERIAQKRAEVAAQQAYVAQLEDRIKKYTIVSRFDGFVITEYVEEGAWVKMGDPVMEVVALDEVDVEAYVTEQHVPHIRPGMTVRVEVPALPDRVFQGIVTTIVPQADTRARTFPVKVRVRNEVNDAGALIKSGMYARVELPTGPAQQGVMVPKDALTFERSGSQVQFNVYVVEERNGQQGKVRPVPVKLGVATPNLIQVTGAIQAGQSVVVEGNERLRPGQDVTIAQAVPPSPDQNVENPGGKP